MLFSMHASIFEPVWIIYISMDLVVVLVDCAAFFLILYSLFYWPAYKRSRKYLSIAWVITFVGPLAVSCIPVRLFIPWDNGNPHMENYLLDFERRNNLQRYQDMILETCRTFTEGYGDASITTLMATVTSLCAKQNNVPASCPRNGPEIFDETDPCYEFQVVGGALEWAEEVNPPMRNELVYSDLLYTSPSNQRVEGFPSTCYDIFGDKMFNGVCNDGFVYPDIDGGESPHLMPCECTAAGCALTGECRLGPDTSVQCSNLYEYMNCSLVNKYYR